MIRRDVFGAIREQWPEHTYKPDDDEPEGTNYYDFFRVGVKDGRYLSEDYYFCQIAAELGIKTYLDTSIMVEHWGKMKFPMKDNNLIKGASLLCNQWSPEAPIDDETKKDILELHKGVQSLIDSRKLKEDGSQEETELKDILLNDVTVSE